MGTFSNNDITDVGRILLADVQAGAVFTPTRIVMGSGSLPSGTTVASLTAVITPVKSLTINKKQRTPDGKFICGGYYTNEDITAPFYFRELALYAKAVYLNADGTVKSESQETLYSYGNAGSTADLMPAYATSTVVGKQLDLVTWIGNTATVNLTIDVGQYIPVAEKGAAGGVATLGTDGKIPSAQLPSMDYVPKAGGSMTGDLTVEAIVKARMFGQLPAHYNTPVEFGQYIDMHVIGSSADYDGRISINDEKDLFYNGKMVFHEGNFKRLTAGKTIYVSASGNDTTGYGTQSAPYKTIAKALSSAPYDLGGYALTISVASGTYAENVYVDGYYGGLLTISATDYSNQPVITGSITVSNCSCVVLLNYLKITVGVTQQAVNVNRGMLSIKNCTITGSTNKYGVFIGELGTCYAYFLTINSCLSAFFTNSGGRCYVAQSTGSGNNIVYNASDGGQINVGLSNTITGTTVYSSANGGRIFAGAQSSVPNY